jgi:hypothetical protein
MSQVFTSILQVFTSWLFRMNVLQRQGNALSLRVDIRIELVSPFISHSNMLFILPHNREAIERE